MITSLGLNAKASPKVRYHIRNVSKKELSRIIREFEKSPYKSYDRRSPKHDTTDSYFYLTIQIENCMMRADSLNSHVYPVRTEMTATKQILSSHICSTDESKLNEFLVNKTLSQICSIDKDESKGITVNDCSTGGRRIIMRSKNINKQKKTQIKRQSMRNIQLHMKGQAILTD